MSDNHWRMQLNNYLQGNGGTKKLTWEIYSEGPSHQILWTAITYVHGVQYARVQSSRQNAAAEEAARITLNALSSDRQRGVY
ncbi:hypothetical protein NM688_g7702 [Phlebia brevispora]|uniref:Uncharacterized protein n=1 Tax=Phlebia brevispora TaxID=194682 RepID=A0ACC1S217_9APHY|nr:hypothetical protein NM688_g7702 [Phlebia brevispora]